MTTPTPPGWTTTPWTMDQLDVESLARRSLVWFAAGGVAFGLLSLPQVLAHDPFTSWWNLLPLFGGLVLGTVAALVLHETVHGLAMLRFGARPQFGIGMMQGKAPYAYATAPGHRFTRRQFWWVAMLPTFVVNAALAALILTLPWGPYLVLPAALHLSGCVGDWAILRMVSTHPAGTLVEDTRDGVILHIPPAG